MVVGAAGRPRLVESEVEARAREPVKVHALRPFPLQREDGVKVPGEDVDGERRARPAEPVQEPEEPDLGAGRDVVARSTGTPLSNCQPDIRM
jgi:hypothetical protein